MAHSDQNAAVLELTTAELLSVEQSKRYAELRGYH
jgi:hypothetical protein